MPQRHNQKPFSTEQTNGTTTALHVASKFGETECAKILINSNAKIEATDKNKKTPLAVAAESNQCGVMEALVAIKTKQDKLSRRAKANL